MWPFRRKSQTPIEEKGLAEPGDDLNAIFGLTPMPVSGTPVTPDSALRIPAVASAIRVISDAVASLVVSVKRIAAGGTKTPVPGHPALPVLRGAANEWTSGFELIRDLVIDALSDGKGGTADVNRFGDGRIAEIVRYRRGAIDVQFDGVTGEPAFKIDVRPHGSVIHLRSPFGRSPLSGLRGHRHAPRARRLRHKALRPRRPTLRRARVPQGRGRGGARGATRDA